MTRKCHICGKTYDERSFLVKLKSGQTYLSFLCKDCAREDENVTIIDQKEEE